MSTEKPKKIYIGKYFLSLLAVIPHSILRHIARFFSAIIWHSKSRLRKIVQTNIDLCFKDLSLAERQKIAHQAITETITTGLQLSRVWKYTKPDCPELYAGIENKELINTALDKGRGLILIIPHLGHWELMHLIIANDYPCTLLCNDADDIIDMDLGDLVEKGRTKTGSRLLKTNQGVKPLINALKAGEIVVIAPDQIPTESKSRLFEDFFGIKVATMSLLPRLAKLSKADILCGFAERQTDGRCIIKVRDVEKSMYSDDINEIAAGMNKSIENLVRECPTQYLWTYKRFRIGPEGKRKIYS